MRRSIVGVACALLLVIVPAAAAAPRDADRDGLPDRWEKRQRLSTKAKSAAADPDRDRVDNANEWRQGTSPRDPDTDGDGRRDGAEDADRDRLSNAAEDATGMDPKDRDTDDDGVPDGRERAGQVVSYRDGVLTVALAGGGRMSGAVTADTELSCRSEQDAESGWLRTKPRRGAAAQAGDPLDAFQDPEDDYGDPGDYDDLDDLEDLEDGDGVAEDEADPGEDEAGGDPGKRDGSRSRACPRGALGAGAVVREAELEAGADGAVFLELELLR